MNTENEVLLLTPGPTKIPFPVREASANAVMHHRSRVFSSMLRSLLDGLQPIFGTVHPVLPVHTTGRGAMEAAVANLLNRGDHVVSICNGKFGEMFATFAEGYGCNVSRICIDWQSDLDLDVVSVFLKENPDVKALTVVHTDTSSGILNPIAELGKLTANTNTLLIVDGISSIGSVEFQMDHWGVDVAITASQKGLMSFPGISFVVLNDKAWTACEHRSLPHFYTDFPAIARISAGNNPETPGTTPVSLVAACYQAVQLLELEGLGNVQQRITKIGTYLRARMVEFGFELQPEFISSYSPTVSLFKVPSGVQPSSFRSYLLEEHNIMIAEGLGLYNSTSVRIGHMGDVRERDIERLLTAVARFTGGEHAHYG